MIAFIEVDSSRVEDGKIRMPWGQGEFGMSVKLPGKEV